LARDGSDEALDSGIFEGDLLASAFLGLGDGQAPDEETATAALLNVGSMGSIRTQTARAYNTAEIQKILGMLPK
jgi:hypothetical protein